MKSQPTLIMIILAMALFLMMATRSQQTTFDKITVREFELVDENGNKRASIIAYPNDDVVLRLMDKNGTIRVKIGGGEDGSGMVLLDNNTEPAIHALSNSKGASLTLTDKDGKKRKY